MPVKRKASEEAEQIKLAKYLDSLGVLWEHVPNEVGQKTSIGSIQKRKRFGVKSGSPDVRIYSRPPLHPGCPGVAIELKGAGGRASPEQVKWVEMLRGLGWMARVIFGADEAIDWLHELGYRFRSMAAGALEDVPK